MAASFQRFKLLATQCALARSSPSRSPLPSSASAAAAAAGGGGRSPVLRLRRSRRSRRGGTLRRFLGRAPPRPRWTDEAEAEAEPSDREATADPAAAEDEEEEKGLLRHKLRDLLVASPPPRGASRGEERASAATRTEAEDAPPLPCGADNGSGGGGGGAWGFGLGLGLRRRLLLRRVWRPVLVAIPSQFLSCSFLDPWIRRE